MSERLSMAGNAQSAPSQELIQFLKEKKLEKYAASICIDQSICESHASGCSQLTALLDMDFVSVAKLSKRCGISVDDQRQLWELVRQRRQPPSIGAKLAQELLSTAEEKEGFTLVSLPFEEKEHCLHFNCQEMTGGVYPWSLRAFNAQIPSQYQDEDASTHIRLLVVGQTSAGNAAQINGILNYFLGMEWHDCIRFQVGRQEAGVADTVDVFMLPAIKGAPVKCKLTLIQAPALGESHGLPFDSAVLDKIKGFFREFPQYVESLSGLCCVPSDSADLLDIWCPILGLFGNDTQLSFMLENTQETAVGYPRGATIFNDMSSLTEPRDQNYAGQRCWIEDRKSMETLFQSLVAFDPVLPNPINEIMERREQLEGTLEELGQRIKVLQERTSRIQNWDGETEGDHETTLDGLQVDVSTECLAVLNLQEQVRICNNRLEDIAMYPSAMPWEDYLEKVIQHMNPGLECQDKVDSLEKLKRTIELLRDAAMPDYLSILLKDFNQQDTVRAHRNRRFFYSY